MKRLSISSLGQLAEADICFGDMTILVGHQASGKSILLQLIKLILDSDDITRTIKKQGFDWRGKLENFLSLYFGEGMSNVWQTGTTQVIVDNQKFELEKAVSKRGRKKEETLFLIPAQRVMTLKNGWPRPFTDYESGDPYVVKQFSERLRLLMEAGLGAGEAIFPQVGRMNKAIRDAIEDSIFGGAKLKLDRSALRNRIVLDIAGQQLPFMVWSAGQREFVPLLMGLYWLMPSSKATKKKYLEWVVIEEPEMGLHPKAISALLITFLELMKRDYKVVISTHSPQILEMVWGIRQLANSESNPESLLEMFDLKRSSLFHKFAKTILDTKKFRTYYFSRQDTSVTVKNISSLDPDNIDAAVADWGGLTEFSTRVSEIVSEAVLKGEH